MVINRYLRCLFGHKKVIVDILRSSFIGSLNTIGDLYVLSLSQSDTPGAENHRPVCFILERARAPRHFFHGKVHPMRKL